MSLTIRQIDTMLYKYQQIFTYLHPSDLKVSLLTNFVLWTPTIAPPVSSIYFAPTTFASPTWKSCEVRKYDQEWIHPLKHCSHAFGAIPVCKRLGKQKNPGKRILKGHATVLPIIKSPGCGQAAFKLLFVLRALLAAQNMFA